MDSEELDYKHLREIYQLEQKTPLLTKINDHLYEEGKKYISKLYTRLEEERKSSRKRIITDQIQNIEKTLKNIYEQREKKIMLAAISKARGGTPSEKHFLPQEQELFSSLFSILMNTRKQQLEIVEPSEIENSAVIQQPSDVKQSIETTVEVETSSEKIKEPNSQQNHQIIRIVQDIPTFIGTDTKEYTLQKGDIVSVPNKLSQMLIQKQVAEIINEPSTIDER